MKLTAEQQANVRAWVAALRSGEFKQTTGCLRDSGGFCCLGVASEVYRRTTGNGEWQGGEFCVDGESADDYLGEPVVEWLGMAGPDPLVGSDGLVILNDKWLMPFAQIADAIEREYLQEVA